MYRERYHKASVTIKPIIEFLPDALPKNTMCPMMVKLPVDPNTIELHLDKLSPIPSSLSPDAIPKYELIGSLAWGRPRKHCMEMVVGNILALHALTTTATCQRYQMKATSLPECLALHH
jgi:hypothetical protein